MTAIATVPNPSKVGDIMTKLKAELMQGLHKLTATGCSSFLEPAAVNGAVPRLLIAE
jgi:hypothetical protein